MTTSMYKGTAKDAGEQHSTPFDTMLSIVTNKRALEALQQRHDWEMEKQAESHKQGLELEGVRGANQLKTQEKANEFQAARGLEVAAMNNARQLMTNSRTLRAIKAAWEKSGRVWDVEAATVELAGELFAKMLSARGEANAADLASGGIPPSPTTTSEVAPPPTQDGTNKPLSLSSTPTNGLDWQASRQGGGTSKVSMIAPDGRRLSVPRSDVKKLIDAGAKLG